MNQNAAQEHELPLRKWHIEVPVITGVTPIDPLHGDRLTAPVIRRSGLLPFDHAGL